MRLRLEESTASTLPSSLNQAEKLLAASLRRASPRSEVPRSEVPRSEVPRSEMPRSEMPRSEMPRSEVPRSEVPRSLWSENHPLDQTAEVRPLLLWCQSPPLSKF